ncbi:ABC transporter ATP-binding protein [Phycicoccus endophyticus]|uniref:ABC transporter ATP-binding protein n=1 Tax=Phycicoccus endophyticus TaxID=1690220 RepID=A0A7G9R2M5_9MICO|nr:ABC transporter ATP-binding protein [Phycicoccus endophyticus]NHI20686.1 ABC transporter ATP-binding protein [Phycicoccus endophyticus]QNN49850.1 ABC transporter ATP-binding protein [Phycicoccus endophyticus]GGL35732.1 ABC transporter [Phycicoccus endophyticus]
MPKRPPWQYGVQPEDLAPADADRLLVWLARRQWRSLLAGACFGIPWMLSVALVPAVVGRAVDDGIVAHDARALVLWSLAVLGLAGLSASAGNGRHWFAVKNWLVSAFRSGVVADRAVRRAGPALTRSMPAGEVLASFTSDFGRMGHTFDVFARFIGAVVSFVVVAVILLRGSVLLGLVMLLGGPLLVASLAFVMRPLQRRQSAQREEAGRLTALGADTVSGLRVLRGIGGEESFLTRYRAQSQTVRRAGIRVAGTQATLDSAQVLLPGVFVLVVTGVGAHLAVAGEISPGQLVAYYGYTAFLTIPLQTAVEMADKLITTRVAARRVARILATEPDHPDRPAGATGTAGPLPEGVLTDPTSGVRVEPGVLTALVSARPEETAAVAARLGRTVGGRHGVTWGATPLDELPVAVVRSHILVSEADPRLFSGPLRRELGGTDDGHRRAALEVADAADALAALDEGLDGELEERGRSLSGGQRQRLALARALLRDPAVLVLVEPTSAVDAHTEARVAERLAEHRKGRTTVVVTASPLLLDRADVVHLVQDGRVVATGSHRELSRTVSAYRAVVVRGEEG